MTLSFRGRGISIRTQLIILVLAVALPIMMVFAWHLVVQAEEARETATSNIKIAAANTAAAIDLYLRDKEVVLSRIAARPLIRALNPKSCDLLIGEYVRLQPDFTNVLVRDLNANTLCSFIPNPVKPEHAAAFPWFKEALRRNQFGVGDAFLGRAAGRWVSLLSYPIRDDVGNMSGLLAMPVDLLKLNAKLFPVASASATIAVVDRDNNILLRSVDPAVWIGKSSTDDTAKMLGNQREGIATARGVDGVRRLFAFVPVPGTGWRVLAGMPEEEIFASYRAMMLRSVAIAIFALLLTLAMAWWIATAIIKPIRELAAISAKVAAGDLGARAQLSGPAEIEAVGQQFNRMLDIRGYREHLVSANEERWKYALEGSGDGVWDWNVVTGKAIFSRRWKEILGYTEPEIGDNIMEARERIHADDLATVNAARQAQLNSLTGHYIIEHRMICKDGSAKWVLSRGVVVSRDATGSALRMVGTITDLTERKQAEAAAEAAREQVEHILESISDAFVTLDSQWRYIYVNERAAQIFGRSREELIGKHIWTEFPNEVGKSFYNAYQKAMKERCHVFVEDYYPPYDSWFENRIYPSRDGISIFFHDISERKLADKALQASEERYRSVIAAMGEGVVVRDGNGMIIDCNASAERIMGSRLADVRGNRYLNPRWQAFREDGSLLPDTERPSHIALNTARARSNQIIGFRRLDGSMLWLSMNTQPLFDPGGTIVTGLVNTFTDITDRRRDEGLRAAKEAAELASLAKSAFLARMSHELRTPLNSILGFAQLLQFDPGVRADDKSQKKVGHIVEAGNHLVAMVDEILDLSRIEAGALSMSPEAVDVDVLIQDCVALAMPQAALRNITFDYAGSGNGAWIRGDRTRLRQILVNLLSNALKYNRAGGSVYVSLGGSATQVEIAVRDTGAGLTAAQINALYQPFNRLGAEGSAIQGTGIGLVIVKQLVEAMDGTINVGSTIGKGSTFTLMFPRVAAGTDVNIEALVPPPPAAIHDDTETFTVLYVEDNPANVELVRDCLALNPNIRLEIAIDGDSGLAAAKLLRPDLILLDINLPGMDGFSVMRHLRAEPLLSLVPCIALSANAMSNEIQRAKVAGFIDYITKPFDVRALLATINTHLRPSGGAAD